MSFDPKYLQTPFQKLIQATKVSKHLNDPERVHKLRTNTRRTEAILDALELPHSKRLRRELKTIRKAAGKVRDMDVLLAKAAGTSTEQEKNCRIQLLAHLGAERKQQRRALARELRRNGKEVRLELKRCIHKIEPLAKKQSSGKQQHAESQALSSALQLSGELGKFSTLTRKNIHQFRIQGKQLRYVLQMAADKDQAFVDALSNMQDAIGEWHDWEELLNIAKEVLQHGERCGIVREIQDRADDAFDQALRTADGVRSQFPRAENKKGPQRVVQASAKIVA